MNSSMSRYQMLAFFLSITAFTAHGMDKPIKCMRDTPQADQVLITSVVEGNLEGVRRALKNHASLLACDSFGNNILMLAEMHNQVAVVGLLEQHLFMPGTSQADKNLINAVRHGDLNGVEDALKRGASVNAEDLFHNSALILAETYQHFEILIVLLRAGARFSNNQRLCYAFVKERNRVSESFDGNNEKIKHLITVGADVNYKDYCSKRPLDYAIESDNEEGIKWLLFAGAKLSFPYAKKALYAAIKKGSVTMVKLLLEQGLPLEDYFDDVDNIWEITQDESIFELLIQYGAPATQEHLYSYLGDFYYNAAIGNTVALSDRAIIENTGAISFHYSRTMLDEALLLAVGQGRVDTVRLLLLSCPDVDIKEASILVTILLKRKNSVLSLKYENYSEIQKLIFSASIEKIRSAAKTGDEENLRSSLQAGTDPDIYFFKDERPLMLAARHLPEQSALTISSLLLLAGATPTIFVDGDDSLLDWVVRHKKYRLARLLLRYGALGSAASIRAIEGLSPLAQAAALGEDNHLSILLQSGATADDLANALMYAATQGQENTLRLILDRVSQIPPITPILVARILERRLLTPQNRDRYTAIQEMLENHQVSTNASATVAPASSAAQSLTINRGISSSINLN